MTPPLKITGASAFTSRPIAPDELRRSIPSSLRLHDVPPEAGDEIGPLTYEVIRHRIWAITEEMGDTLKRMSGSISVTEVNDFDFTICDEIGQEVQVGLYNTGLVASMDLAIYWTLLHRSESPGIEEGDMFLCNDPWVGGGLHQNDVAILAPVFHDGRLFAWTTAICHVEDLGGSAPGSFSPTATDVFAESLPTPPVKIVRGHRLQQDVVDLYLRRSRVPEMVGLDLRAKIGANNIARDRLLALIDRYGPDQVKAVMKRMMDDSERRLRAKLTSLPDGSWSSVGYQEQSGLGDRGMHKIALTMTKRADHLTFDFTGTDPQTGMINCPYSGMRAGVMFALLPILAGDIPWAAGGLMRCFDIVSEEGTINNATFPAAVAKAPVGPAWASSNLVADCLARMLDTDEDQRPRVQSVCAGTYDGCGLMGVDEEGQPFFGGFADSMASGYGAQVDADGVDTGGLFVIPMGRAPDVEMTEFSQPLLYLWRREEADTGGPGRQRGGVSGSICAVPHGVGGPMLAMFTGASKAASMSPGLAGGYPGGTQLDIVVHESRAHEALRAGEIPQSLDELAGTRQIVQAHDELRVEPAGAIYLQWAGGGGYGDPLRRDPASVAADLAAGKISATAAHEVYGVVLDESSLEADHSATAARRAELIQRRRTGAGSPDRRARTCGVQGARPLDDNIAVLPAEGGEPERLCCRHCGELLGERDGDHLSRLPRQVTGPEGAGPGAWPDASTYVDDEVVFRQVYCPGCFTALLTQVVPARQPLTG
ncbi:hydantoinase B/oxoprolinase family protein [Actinomadura chibensis]|uniref:Hydantoinase B/oxoprolinase family protein n=1 Tax=Actinomadura chibensis TaxID=392828 RepID=A0A5D0NX60_9ACTN|nr:hydantoinase B/oxoprolinase family protein [Actinomadura chibensis]TYB48862.1 hydantoinase B/oxoprolinase family protein [Actinomadura chibensis]